MQLTSKDGFLKRLAGLQFPRQDRLTQNLEHLLGLGESSDRLEGLSHGLILNECLLLIDTRLSLRSVGKCNASAASGISLTEQAQRNRREHTHRPIPKKRPAGEFHHREHTYIAQEEGGHHCPSFHLPGNQCQDEQAE